ncbi:class I SAM-dependent DNA methyltransferase [Streptomyces griseoaurantiacus]|uniref:class I SAM-dependent DNA methyltransferase n=1 Tax=Streptomyces griseoaurantiacus TaxID=68213 RepID=UPI00363ED1BD
MAAPDALTATREAYDAVAGTYADMFRESLREEPVERALLAAFAETVRADGGGPVADLGCGPGHVTAHLRDLGLRAFGVDASPEMIELARRDHPDLRFDIGSMAALDLPGGTLGGILSRWSIIHTPPAEVPAVLAEFARVLAPGGRLTLSFWATEDPSVPSRPFDHAVAPAHRWSPDRLAGLLREHGVHETSRTYQEPLPTDRRQFRTVHLLARRTPAP